MGSDTNIKNYAVFMADDDIDDLELMESAFKDIGFEFPITCFTDGQKLLNHLIDESIQYPAIVLLDLNMPKNSGKSILDKIRHNAHLANVSVIVYSTSNAENDIVEAYELGCNAYVIKPNCYNEIKKIAKGIKNLWFDIHNITKARINSSSLA